MSKQLGFDIQYADPTTHNEVTWAAPTPALVKAIRDAAWKVSDVETTGLNPASKEQTFSGKDLRRGINPELRLRVLSVCFPTPQGQNLVAFDFDRLTETQRQELCQAALSGAMFGHNVGFDAYWMRTKARKTVPAYLLDSMLLARVLRPEQPLLLAALANDENADPAFRDEAVASFIQKRSGWSLADLALTQLERILSKDLQGPKNWCEPFLTQQNYDYAAGDAKTTHELLCKLFACGTDDNLLEVYLARRAKHPALSLIEPQVWDVVRMREFGMPWSEDVAEHYVKTQWEKVREMADKLVALEPALQPHYLTLANAEEGVTAEMRAVLGEAFQRRGLVLEVTEKEGLLKIGEKDLRRAKAQKADEARELFDVWVPLQRAKKAGGMAREFTAFAKRSDDHRLHSNIGHGPVTGRLSSSEPNVQQSPRDQGFRNGVAAAEGKKVVGADYSALDMRNGAALAIRAQREIFEAYLGQRETAPEALKIIAAVVEGRRKLAQFGHDEQVARTSFEQWKAGRDQVADSSDARKAYWDTYRKRARQLLLARFGRCYAYVRDKADAAGTGDWGSLRDAFAIPGMDIHSWTALGMMGRDPVNLFAGKSPENVVAELKKAKKELGDKRQTGKVGNLSLLYAMQTAGLVDAAAKNYNIHWEFDEADKVRADWFATYVEVDLWHAWTELNPCGEVYIPDPEKGGRFVKKQVYESYTLGNRLIYAFGLNAALSYQDQSTGADILGTVMTTMSQKHPEVFACTVNQVHDELVYEIPDDKVDGYVRTIQDVMVGCAEQFTMPYGVRIECSPTVGQAWLKD